jgi:hypothetical protein
MFGEFYFSKIAFADSFQKFIVANMYIIASRASAVS